MQDLLDLTEDLVYYLLCATLVTQGPTAAALHALRASTRKQRGALPTMTAWLASSLLLRGRAAL